LITGSANDRRVHGHPVAWLEALDRAAGLFNNTSALMANDERIPDDLVADPAFSIIMDIRAAQSSSADAKQDIRVSLQSRLMDIPDFDFPDSCEDRGFHLNRSISSPIFGKGSRSGRTGRRAG
jgi:hypothetical protein